MGEICSNRGNEKKQSKEIRLINSVPCQLPGFRTHSIEGERRVCWLEIKVGNVTKNSAKERSKSAKKWRRYEAAKLVRENGKLVPKLILFNAEIVKMKLGVDLALLDPRSHHTS